MWESLQYVNNKWALYAVISISILIVLKSWLNKTERIIEKLPENDRKSIVKLEFFGNFLFKIILLSVLIVGFISLFPIINNNIESINRKVPSSIENMKEKKEYCPKNYSENLNASANCITGIRP